MAKLGGESRKPEGDSGMDRFEHCLYHQASPGKSFAPSTDHSARLWVKMSRLVSPRKQVQRKEHQVLQNWSRRGRTSQFFTKKNSQEDLRAPGSKARAVRLPFSSAGDTRASSPIPNVPAELCPRNQISPRASPPHFPAEKLLRR